MVSSLAFLVITTDALSVDRGRLTDFPEANDDVDTAHYFPGNPEGKLLSGESLKVILGFRNSGETTLTVSQIAGSLNSPFRFNMYVTNFSAVTYNSVVEPGKETSFEYMFQIDPQLAGHEFTLALTAFYLDDSEHYSSTFINTSFPVFDPVASFDSKTVFVCGSLLSLAFSATYATLHVTGTLSGVKTLTRKILWSTGGSKHDIHHQGLIQRNDWLRDTAWAIH